MIEKELKIITPSIQTIADTIDMIHNVTNEKTPTEMVDEICQRYWVINNNNAPNSYSLFTTDILVSDIKYCDNELYESLKNKYGDTINKFIHKEFDFGDKFINLIISIVEKENIDNITIVLFYDDTQLRLHIIDLLINNTEIINKGWTHSMESDISMNRITIHSKVLADQIN